VQPEQPDTHAPTAGLSRLTVLASTPGEPPQALRLEFTAEVRVL